MTVRDLGRPRAQSAIDVVRRFRAVRCGTSFVAMDRAVEAMTFTRTAVGTVYAHAVEDRFAPLADLINRADVPFDAIVAAGDAPPAPEGDYEVRR
ncbi:MAG: hypothetical protein JNJ88_03715 [Planctomycetes bacterium]|nr:hypothetical protein [Planctomycetota bacterium]